MRSSIVLGRSVFIKFKKITFFFYSGFVIIIIILLYYARVCVCVCVRSTHSFAYKSFVSLLSRAHPQSSVLLLLLLVGTLTFTPRALIIIIGVIFDRYEFSFFCFFFISLLRFWSVVWRVFIIIYVLYNIVSDVW